MKPHTPRSASDPVSAEARRDSTQNQPPTGVGRAAIEDEGTSAKEPLVLANASDVLGSRFSYRGRDESADHRSAESTRDGH